MPNEDALTDDKAPRALRRSGYAVLALTLTGALYLIAVRGEALLVDLAAMAAWCF